MPNTYKRDSQVRLTATFKNSSGTVTDPTTIKVKYKTPAGVETTKTYVTDAEVVRSSTGIYYIDLTLTQTGRWHYRWEGTGTIIATSEASLDVDASQFA